MFPLKNLKMRAHIIQSIRTFLIGRDYLEVDTPCRLPVPLPEANIIPQASEGWFLQTSPESCLKRLLAAGLPRIFQIAHAFRQGERGDRHLPEFVLAEWYRVKSNYHDMMEETEQMIRFVAAQTGFGDRLCYQGKTIDISSDWPRMSVAQAFERFSRLSLVEALEQNLFDEIIGCEIEPHLGWERPLFLYDYPAPEQASFARLKKDDSSLAERFELYMGGLELCNGFSELTGTKHYQQRFKREQQASGRNCPWPEKFLNEIGEMPEAAGNALGLDHLVMLLCDAATIDEVVAFTPETL